MSELFTLPVLLGIIYSGIRLATPYLYAAIGETFAQRSGVLKSGRRRHHADGCLLRVLCRYENGQSLAGSAGCSRGGIIDGLDDGGN